MGERSERWNGAARSGKRASVCPRQAPAPRHFYFVSCQHIFSLPDSSGYGDKRDRNKPFGPGGSTRRLHHQLIDRLTGDLLMGAN